jgi:predicted PurR-regulated permease PerM
MSDNAQRIALIERILLVLLVIGLFVAVLAVIRPFFTAILFGASLATAAWPVRQALVRHGLGHGMTATLLLLSSLALIGIPMLAVAPNLADQLTDLMQRVQSYFAAAPELPARLGRLPLIGDRLAAGWNHLVESGGNLRSLAASYAVDIEQVIVASARALADSVVQVILALVVATMFWASGEKLVAILHDVLRRLGGFTAEHTLDVAGLAIRGVAYGVIGTALIQALVLTIGLLLAGVPGAGMLGFIGLLLAISQIGAPLIVVLWGGAAWWLFGQDQQAWGIFMIVWGLIVSTIDNIIKPWLIGFGVEMPLSLTILGVFGGFVAFGFLGLFIGPTLIAVGFTLLQAWREGPEAITEPTPVSEARLKPSSIGPSIEE